MGFYKFRYSIALVFLKWCMYVHFSLIFQSPYFACMFNGSWRESLLSEIDLQIPDPAIDNLGNTSEQGIKVMWFIWRYIHVWYFWGYIAQHIMRTEVSGTVVLNNIYLIFIINVVSSLVFFFNLWEQIELKKIKENCIWIKFWFWTSNHTLENRNSSSKQWWLR